MAATPSESCMPPRISLVLNPLTDEALRLAAQIGVEDITYYNMDDMPHSVEELSQLKLWIEGSGLFSSRKRCPGFRSW